MTHMAWGAMSASTCTQHSSMGACVLRISTQEGDRTMRSMVVLLSFVPSPDERALAPTPNLWSYCRCTKNQPLRCNGEVGTRPPPDVGGLNGGHGHSSHVLSEMSSPNQPALNSPSDQYTQSGLLFVSDPGKRILEHIPSRQVDHMQSHHLSG